jgi:hypothetical protein
VTLACCAKLEKPDMRRLRSALPPPLALACALEPVRAHGSVTE